MTPVDPNTITDAHDLSHLQLLYYVSAAFSVILGAVGAVFAGGIYFRNKLQKLVKDMCQGCPAEKMQDSFKDLEDRVEVLEKTAVTDTEHRQDIGRLFKLVEETRKDITTRIDALMALFVKPNV